LIGSSPKKNLVNVCTIYVVISSFGLATRVKLKAKDRRQSEELLGPCWEVHWELGEHVENPFKP